MWGCVLDSKFFLAYLLISTIAYYLIFFLIFFLAQVLVLESHFRIYHGKKMVDYRLFLNSFREDDEDPGEDFGGELVADEYTAAHSTASAASHTSDSETVTTTGAVVNEEIDHAQGSSSAEGKVESKTENGAQNNAPFSSAGTASNGSSEEVNTDKETPSVGSPRDDTPPVAQQLVVVEVKEVAEGAKEATFGTSPTATSRKKVSFVCTDEEAEESASAPTTGFSPSSTSNNNGNGNNSMDGFSSSPDSTLSSSSKGFASPDTLGTPSPRTRRVSSSAKLGRRNSESLIRSVDVSPPVLLPTQMYCSHRISRELMEVLYIDYKEVEGAFNFFDRDHDGFISAAEFRATCKELNKYLPRGQKIRDIDSMLMLMDFEETGEIAFNNFFELFRLSEMKLNVGIDDEDSLHSSLHHSDVRDIGRQHSISGYGSFSAGAPSKLAIHGVQINVDSEFPAPRSPTAAALAAAAAAAAAASSPTAAAAGAGTRGLGTEESKLARGDSPLGLNIDA